MANSAKSEPNTALLKKMIAREPDTVRAAHFRRLMEGPVSLEALTGKADPQRAHRNALIDALPPVKPVVDVTGAESAHRPSGFATLQTPTGELQPQLTGQGD